MWATLVTSVWFWLFVAFTLLGMVEIIVFLIATLNNEAYAKQYMEHINAIGIYMSNKLQDESALYGQNEFADIDKISQDIHEIEVGVDEIGKFIDEEHYTSNPTYSLYCCFYYGNVNKREILNLCHRIGIDYDKSIKRHEKEFKNSFICLFVPLCKFYRGFRFVIRLLKNELQKININIDSSNILENFLSIVAEISSIVGVILEIVK